MDQNNRNQGGNQQGENRSGDQERNQGGGQSGGNQERGQGNRDEQNPNADPNWEPATTGAVIDPEHDGRLKENREEGVTKGTTQHSSQAPIVGQDNSGSVNAEDRGGQGSGSSQGGQSQDEGSDRDELSTRGSQQQGSNQKQSSSADTNKNRSQQD